MTVHLDANQVPANLRGSYDGKMFKAEVCERVTIPMDAGLWSGGSREIYRVVRLADGAEIQPIDPNASPWDPSRKERIVQLETGIAVIRHTMFCGKDLGLTFYVHPTNAAAMLPKPVELTPFERIVLKATRELKSSYNGKDRYQMTCCDYGQKPTMTRGEWDSAKTSLIAQGYLNKAGAITTKGRNALEV